LWRPPAQLVTSRIGSNRPARPYLVTIHHWQTPNTHTKRAEISWKNKKKKRKKKDDLYLPSDDETSL